MNRPRVDAPLDPAARGEPASDDLDQLVTALNERRVRLAFQPVFRATTREHVWSEALVRVVGEDGEVFSGGPLASAAEEVGLIHMLDRRALDLAAAHLASLPEARVAVNVSAATTADESWLEALSSWLAMRPDLADRLMVEVTETAAIADLGVTAAFVTELHARGVGKDRPRAQGAVTPSVGSRCGRSRRRLRDRGRESPRSRGR